MPVRTKCAVSTGSIAFSGSLVGKMRNHAFVRSKALVAIAFLKDGLAWNEWIAAWTGARSYGNPVQFPCVAVADEFTPMQPNDGAQINEWRFIYPDDPVWLAILHHAKIL